NNLIIRNFATNAIADVGPGYGGGIASVTSTLTITNNHIDSNSARSGGGVYISSATEPLPTLIANNTIASNVALGTSASDGGGGIYLGNSAGEIINNVIEDNASQGEGSGIELWSGTNVSLVNNTILRNRSAVSWGSAVAPVPRGLRFLNNLVAFGSGGVSV